ncbi:Sterol 24-C-methyltransferase [Pseudocercospora fuligena]|uniref:Sterol 24-C-methyltransferase n=1 Tax=Pseudocercospora fuligena TaxID=685502 RepID=A0A8H6VGG4_9PEZI|nr:Sterol 24-C-methyltransferase [Pseudocercospora fuligena]
MAPSAVYFQKEDFARDQAFSQALHGKTASARRHKDQDAQRLAMAEYFKHWDNKLNANNETDDVRKSRRDEYASLTQQYYNLVTDIYEYGWGHSFHFCRFRKGESFSQAMARHEHYLALKMGLQEGSQVLDVGCGVGGPAREIATFSGANITGLNNNDYQVERAIRYATKEGMDKQLSFVKGDFMQMSFPDNSFDAVYSIEATVHAPSLQGVYSDIFRVLKPGGVFGVYEWLMTDLYDNDNPTHRQIRLDIEQGDGISNMEKIEVALAAVKAAGFELELHENLANRADDAPWYKLISGDLKLTQSIWDVPTLARMTYAGRFVMRRLLGTLELVGIAPKGTLKVAESLVVAADALVAGAKQDLFTPMYLIVARKPKA